MFPSFSEDETGTNGLSSFGHPMRCSGPELMLNLIFDRKIAPVKKLVLLGQKFV
jgi:hypothetical protein